MIFALGFSAFAEVLPPSPEDILKQERPASWPEWVDVEMDASILTDESLKQKFTECFSQAPPLMLDLSDEALFGDDGIYPKEADPQKENTEALVKATYWHPKKKGFSITCGIRLQGSGSITQSPKRNFRIRFAKKFGQGSLKCPLFEDGEAQEFENLLIRNITEEGVLTPKKASALYRSLLDEVTPLLLAEALRWGDLQRKKSYLPHGKEWQNLTGPQSWLFLNSFPYARLP